MEKELEMLYEQGIDKSLIEGVEAFRACHTVEEKEKSRMIKPDIWHEMLCQLTKRHDGRIHILSLMPTIYI